MGEIFPFFAGMFQATRRRLAIWYTSVTAILLLLFATGFYLYVRGTLVERIDDTLSHVVEIVQRSLVIEPPVSLTQPNQPIALRINIDASFPSNVAAVEDDHIDLEWFDPNGQLLWSTFSAPLNIPLHPNSDGETVYVNILTRDNSENAESGVYASTYGLRQITQCVQISGQVVGYLRVSHPWFEVSKPSRQLIRDLSLGSLLVIGAVAAIGWFLSGLAIAPVRDSYQSLKQFTADASHELRNPIAVIQTNVQVALADPDPSLQQDQLRVIERLTRRLGKLVDDLLFLARQDSGITNIQISPVKLDRLLQEVVEEQQVIAVEKDLLLDLQVVDKATELEVEKGHPAYSMNGDAGQLTRLFTNLISNAVQYTSRGKVEVTLQRVKLQGTTYAQIQVQDTGSGIPPDALPYIFDRFYRVDPARTALIQGKRTDRTTGSGLGLAIAKVIVENHQGHIQVLSTVDRGTQFTVLLPVTKHVVSTHPSENSANSPHGK